MARFDKHYFVANALAWTAMILVRGSIMLAFGYKPSRAWDRITISPDQERTADEKRWGR